MIMFIHLSHIGAGDDLIARNPFIEQLCAEHFRQITSFNTCNNPLRYITLQFPFRTGYIICRAQRKMKMQGPFFKIGLRISKWGQHSIKPSAKPILYVRKLRHREVK